MDNSKFHRYELLEWARRYGEENHGLFPILAELRPGPTRWVAGGAVRDFARGVPIDSDVDVFFADENAFVEFMVEMRARLDYRETRNAETVTTFFITVNEKPVLCQAVRLAYYRDMEDCIDQFDFTVCQFATDGTSMVCGLYSLFDLARKRLAVHRVTFGASSVRRMLKYAQRGFTACQGCIVNLLEGMNADESLIRAEVKYVD